MYHSSMQRTTESKVAVNLKFGLNVDIHICVFKDELMS